MFEIIFTTTAIILTVGSTHKTIGPTVFLKPLLVAYFSRIIRTKQRVQIAKASLENNIKQKTDMQRQKIFRFLRIFAHVVILLICKSNVVATTYALPPPSKYGV